MLRLSYPAYRFASGPWPPTRHTSRFRSFFGHGSGNEIAPAAFDAGAGLLDPPPHLRAHPAVGVPLGRDPVDPEDVFRDLALGLACPLPVQHRHQRAILAPRTRPFRGAGRPATLQKSSNRRTVCGIRNPKPCRISIPPSAGNAAGPRIPTCTTAPPHSILSTRPPPVRRRPEAAATGPPAIRRIRSQAIPDPVARADTALGARSPA